MHALCLLIHRHGLSGDSVPAEFGFGAEASGAAELLSECRLPHYLVDSLSQARFEAFGIGYVKVHEVTGDPVNDYLGNSAHVAGDDGCSARHRLKVHNAQWFVYRGTDENTRRAIQSGDRGTIKLTVNPHDSGASIILE